MTRYNAGLRAGFTLVEVMIAMTITTFIFMMVSGVWYDMARSTNESLVAARVSQEAHFVLEVLRRDLGGFLPGKEKEKNDENKLVGRLATGADELMLCFDSDKADGLPAWGKPDTVILYEVQNGQLLRIEQTNKGKFTVVANNITSFTPTQLSKGVRIDFTVTYEDLSRSFTLIAQDP